MFYGKVLAFSRLCWQISLKATQDLWRQNQFTADSLKKNLSSSRFITYKKRVVPSVSADILPSACIFYFTVFRMLLRMVGVKPPANHSTGCEGWTRQCLIKSCIQEERWAKQKEQTLHAVYKPFLSFYIKSKKHLSFTPWRLLGFLWWMQRLLQLWNERKTTALAMNHLLAL